MASAPSLETYREMFKHDEAGFSSLLKHTSDDSVTVLGDGAHKVVALDGRKLHSSRDPLLEAKRFARAQDLAETQSILLLGYASGYAAQELAARIERVLWVYEPSLDVLAQGLFHCPSNPKIQILSSPHAVQLALSQLLRVRKQLQVLAWPPSARMQSLQFHEVVQTVSDVVNQAQRRETTIQVRSQGWLNHYLENIKHLSERANLNAYRDKFKDYPAIVCSAGPSLTKNAALLRKLQDQCLILCVNTAARALASIGVRPHGIVSVESLNISAQLEDIEWLGEVTGFLDVTGHPQAFDLPFKHIVPLCVTTSSSAKFSEKLCPGQTFAAGNSVANASMSIARRLGCPGIVLIGQDLAYENDRVYASGTIFEDIRVNFSDQSSHHVNTETKAKIERSSQGVFPERITAKQSFPKREVPAWGDPSSKTVMSNEEFCAFRDWFSEASSVLAEEGVWMINATQGGAHIPGWTEMTLEEAIAQKELDKPLEAGQLPVSTLLDQLAQSRPLPRASIIEALEVEQQGILDVLRIVLSSQGLVNSDPDGDVMANEDLSARLSMIYQELNTRIQNCPLLQDRLTAPLAQLLQRQQINTLNVSKLIENQIQKLHTLLQDAIASLDPQNASTRDAELEQAS